MRSRNRTRVSLQKLQWNTTTIPSAQVERSTKHNLSCMTRLEGHGVRRASNLKSKMGRGRAPGIEPSPPRSCAMNAPKGETRWRPMRCLRCGALTNELDTQKRVGEKPREERRDAACPRNRTQSSWRDAAHARWHRQSASTSHNKPEPLRCGS